MVRRRCQSQCPSPIRRTESRRQETQSRGEQLNIRRSFQQLRECEQEVDDRGRAPVYYAWSVYPMDVVDEVDVVDE